MPDYIYLLENRLSVDQRNALSILREVAREAGMILFLTGDAVRDLTSGHAVRDLEVAIHGNALKLKKSIEKRGAKVWGESEASRSLYLCFQGTVRVDLVSTQSVEFPKPGKPVYHAASIQEDLRRRDFTVNAMAVSLNDGSFGLFMDPLNGAADIEARSLRLVSNYGFLQEPTLLIRATRYHARLGWELDPKTRTRYDNAREEGVIEHLSEEARSQELEQIGHEEDGLKVLHALEAEGWMKILFPPWTAAKADEEKLKALHDLAVALLLEGVHADMSAAQMQLLTAKLAPKDLSALKKLMLRPGFVEEWNSLDSLASGFAKVLLSRENATPSAAYKLFTTYDPEAILWLGFTSKDHAVQERFNLFLKVWPEARQRIPHALMQEMRITPELGTYQKIVHAIFLELIDGRITNPEEARAFLEPHSPPAPPPQVTIKRPRAKRGAEAKVKEQAFDDEDSEDALDEDEDIDGMGQDEEEIDLGLKLPKVELDSEILDEDEAPDEEDLESEESDEDAEPALPKRGAKAATSKVSKSAPAPSKSEKPAPAAKGKVAAKAAEPPPAKSLPAKKAAPAPHGKPAPPAKPQAAKRSVSPSVAPKAAVNSPAKSPARPAPKPPAGPAPRPQAKAKPKAAAKPARKFAPSKAKGKPAPLAKSKPASPARKAKPAPRKPAPKPGKKR